MSARRDVVPLLERVAELASLEGHDGRSGASVSRGLLDDGTPVIVKRSDPATDLTTAIGGGIGDRELRLWETGVLDRLPAPLGHPILAAGWLGAEVVTVMRDLGSDVLSWDRTLSRQEVHRMFAAVASMHVAFAGNQPDDLCALDNRLSAFSPSRMRDLARDDDSLPALILRGWERFAELVPDDVATSVFAVLEQPAKLARALGAEPQTLLHGDFWLVNAALRTDEVVLLDWAIATSGPGVLDFVTFADGCFSNVDMSREALIDEIRLTTAPYSDAQTLRVALFCGLSEMGWNKALDAVDHDDPAQRVSALDELDWWVARAREALETGRIG